MGNGHFKDVVEVTKKTYDQIARDYYQRIYSSLEREIWEFEQKILINRLLVLAGLERPKILDIGCGDGRDTAYLKERGVEVIGIDFSSGMLTEARRRIPTGDFREMDMRSLDFPNDYFDGI